MNEFDQHGFRCRLEWGRRGARDAAARGDILIVVDVLRFSTTVATAIHYGGAIYPCLETEDVEGVARRVGAVAGAKTADAGRFTLSPHSYRDMTPDTRIALSSLNGATCSRYAAEAPYLFVGALVNAQAVGEIVSQILETTGLNVTVNACGERWRTPTDGEEIRMAIEDYLGAGAILSCLAGSKSPEARVCESAFQNSKERLEELLLDCGSGRELIARGQRDDVLHAARLNAYDVVPVMRNGFLVSHV